MDKWNWPLTFLTHCFFWPRFLIGQFFILLACIGSVLLTKCCVKKGNRPGPTLNYINGLMLAFASGSALIALTTYCWRRKKREYCYKKWLGEDWVCDKENGYKNAGTFVANHQNFCDIFLYLACFNPTPGFVAKDSIKNVFAIGYISDIVLNSMFYVRGDKKTAGNLFS